MEQINNTNKCCATCAYWLGREILIVLFLSKYSVEWIPVAAGESTEQKPTV